MQWNPGLAEETEVEHAMGERRCINDAAEDITADCNR
jgi:hypothetical protein